MNCNFPNCHRTGHMKTVHYPRKEDTVNRLRSKYGPDFKINLNNLKRSGSAETNSREAKKAREGHRK